MIVLFGLEPKSVVVAHMLEKLRGTKAVMLDPERKFFFEQVEDARSADYDKIYEEYRSKHGKIDFLEDGKLYEVVSGDIFWALRFGSLDRSSLVLQMLDKIEAMGSKSYLSEETPESREMRFRVRRVLAEFNRAVRYIKFTRFDEVKLSLGSASFENDIADMVLRAEATRCPDGYTIAVHAEKATNIMVHGTSYLARTQKIPLSPERRGFKHFWGGLPESGGDLIWKDDMHNIAEFPRMPLPKGQEMPEKVLDRQTATLDDFVGRLAE
jgi:hypothetical protein